MTDYARYYLEHLRLAILRLLAEQPDYRLNDSLLSGLLETYGFSPARDELHATLDWLADMELIVKRDMNGLVVAELTQNGRDVAQGRKIIDGIKRPGPAFQ